MFVPYNHLQDNIVFTSKARAYQSETSFRFSTLGLAPCLASKHYTRPERLARGKPSGLLRKFITYYRKSFITSPPAGTTVIKYLTRNHKIEGSDPATNTRREKRAKPASAISNLEVVWAEFSTLR